MLNTPIKWRSKLLSIGTAEEWIFTSLISCSVFFDFFLDIQFATIITLISEMSLSLKLVSFPFCDVYELHRTEVQIYEEQNSTNWWFLSCFQFPRCGFAFTETVGWRKLKSKEHKGISVEVFSCYWACVLLNAILYDFLLPVKSLRSSSYYVRFSEKMCIRMTEAVSVKSAKESAATWCGTCFLLSTKLFQVPVWNRVS